MYLSHRMKNIHDTTTGDEAKLRHPIHSQKVLIVALLVPVIVHVIVHIIVRAVVTDAIAPHHVLDTTVLVLDHLAAAIILVMIQVVIIIVLAILQTVEMITDEMTITPLNPIQEMEIKARTLFVTRLHYRVSKSQLSEFFEQNGLAVKKVSLITDKSSGRSKGMAYVELCKYDDVEKGVALNGTVLEGIHMEIQRVAVQTEAQSALFDILASTTAIPAIQPDLGLKLTGTSSVVISNVHPRITRDEIQTIFKTFGDVVGLKEIEVPQDPPPETTRNGPNKAWQVEFAVVESADDAVLVLDGKEIGTIVKVQHKIDWDRDRSDQNHTSF
ncbi:hypothetical protein BLNAU_15945 [Blattamonas nauphoetae]|uniref:RRM domain-containing protein n=1 Tax=Blattamonas nauphoetae TaxID=2049346 RepID=A0ABQ9XE12_9EUKA|nr:hypothetical protein BLNAU_15945 [Blattamonas nauphoetae]